MISKAPYRVPSIRTSRRKDCLNNNTFIKGQCINPLLSVVTGKCAMKMYVKLLSGVLNELIPLQTVV